MRIVVFRAGRYHFKDSIGIPHPKLICWIARSCSRRRRRISGTSTRHEQEIRRYNASLTDVDFAQIRPSSEIEQSCFDEEVRRRSTADPGQPLPKHLRLSPVTVCVNLGFGFGPEITFGIPSRCVCCMGLGEEPLVASQSSGRTYTTLTFQICRICLKHVKQKKTIDACMTFGVIVIFMLTLTLPGPSAVILTAVSALIAWAASLELNRRKRRPECWCFGSPVRLLDRGGRFEFANAEYADAFRKLNHLHAS